MGIKKQLSTGNSLTPLVTPPQDNSKKEITKRRSVFYVFFGEFIDLLLLLS